MGHDETLRRNGCEKERVDLMAEKKTQAKTDAAETKPRPKRGRGGTENFPSTANKKLERTPEGRAAIRRILSESKHGA